MNELNFQQVAGASPIVGGQSPMMQAMEPSGGTSEFKIMFRGNTAHTVQIMDELGHYVSVHPSLIRRIQRALDFGA